MSETSGFFVSQGGDRRYTPAWLASYIKALVTTGVYKDELAVMAGDGMTISLNYGRAWVEGYLYLNDVPMTMAIGNADSVLGRKDSVVVRLNLTDRTITAMVLPGTFSASPVAPVPTRNADIYDLKLAEVNVPAGTTKITQDLILDTRLDDAICGITVCTVQHIPTSTFLAQMQAGFASFIQESAASFEDFEADYKEALHQAVEDAETSAGSAEQSAGAASGSAKLAKSYAVGGTGTRGGEDTNNAKYYSEKSKASADSAAGSVQIIEENAGGIQAVKDNLDAILSAPDHAQSAAASAHSAADEADRSEDGATLSESWAVGGTGTRQGEDENNARYWADRAQAEAERASVPPVEGVYNIVLADRITGDRYALIVERGRLALLGVSDALEATSPLIIDQADGKAYAVIVEDGRLMIEEAE